MKERIKHLILFLILIGIDQGSKFWARTCLQNKDPLIIIPNKILNFQYNENTGAVWGILSGRIDFLKIFTLIVLVFILFVYFKIPQGKRYGILKILSVFIMAGAVGNLIDRFVLGHVVDFIYFEIIDFPLFNFADCCLTVSSILLFLFAMFYYKEEDFAFLGTAFTGKKKEKEEIKEAGEDEASEDDDNQDSN